MELEDGGKRSKLSTEYLYKLSLSHSRVSEEFIVLHNSYPSYMYALIQHPPLINPAVGQHCLLYIQETTMDRSSYDIKLNADG